MAETDPTNNPTRATPPRPGGPPGGSADPTAPWADHPPRIGRYEVRGKLGEGGCGRVYRAFDPDLGREVAVKVQLPDAATPAGRARFLREARAAGAIHHPNVCPVFDVGTDGDAPFIVMRYVPGGTLADQLAARAGPLPVRTAVGLARRVAAGVAAAHALGVVHRDLKPQNVLWDAAARQVLVTDFGLARVAGEDGSTRTGDVLGTPRYMAPEQWRGDHAAVGPATDVYALGVILYRLLAGETPYTGAPYEVMHRALAGNPPPPSARRPGLAPALDAICLRAMALDPAARFPTAKALADALAALRPADLESATVSGLTPVVPPDPEPTPPVPRKRPEPPADPPTRRETTGGPTGRAGKPRARLAVIAAAAVVAVLLVGAGVGVVLTTRDPGTKAGAPTPGGAAAPPAEDAAAAGLKQVMAALDQYQRENGGYFPPATVGARVIPKGSPGPRRSWRVAILPQLGERELYDRFRPDEPWDSPTNQALIPLMPRAFLGSLPGAAADGKTAFRGLVGNRAAFEPYTSRMLTSITDGWSYTIGVVESGPPVEWTKPDDITFDGKTAPPLASPVGRPFVLIGMLDGEVRRLDPTRVPADALVRAIDGNDGSLGSQLDSPGGEP